MNVKEFDYELDKEFIAQSPTEKRDESKLMVFDGNIKHLQFNKIIDYLQKDDVLVINNTKVKRSRLNGKKESGSDAEIILLQDLGKYVFRCKIKSRRPQVGSCLIFDKGLKGKIERKENAEYDVRFNMDPYVVRMNVPLPAYVKNNDIDDERYQTVYAKKEGSLAAPTAGLHFTDKLIEKIKAKGVNVVEVCLHIGFGTFLPISTKKVEEHKMHREIFEITKEAAQMINKRKGRLFVCGTTSLRALESSSKNGKVIASKKETDIFIYPGYEFQSGIDCLITNFHLPKSTLLLMVGAFIGKDKLFELYEKAKEKDYRFYSFGDAMLLSKLSLNSQPQ